MTELHSMLRSMARTPMFVLVSILSLAMGIGVNTAIYSLFDQILLRKLPVRNPDELVFLYHPGPMQGSVTSDEAGNPSFSYPMFRELQRDQTPFAGLFGARNAVASLAYKNQASSGSVHVVSGNYFDLLGVKPALGRLFTEDDDRVPGGHPIVVLGDAYWRNRFGADPSVLNQTLNVNGYAMTIIGVAPQGFACERLGSVPDVFVPITMRKELSPDWDGMQNRLDAWVSLTGRLKPGMSREQAEMAINVSYRAQLEQDAQLLKADEEFLKRFRAKRILLKPGAHGRGGLREEGVSRLTLLMGMTLLVLLIACANIANLQLARGAARAREIAVRLALGVTRGRLIGQLLLESCVLSLAGGALGLAAAYWTLQAIIASLPPWTGMTAFLSSSLDGRILFFCLALSVGSGVLFGLFPALQASKPDLVKVLNDQAGQATPTGSANLFRKLLVTAQVAISLLLLISAGLFTGTLLNLRRVELGIRIDHLLTFFVAPRLNNYTDQRSAQFYAQLTERLAALPGVRLVSGATVPAIAGSSSTMNVTVPGFTPSGEGTTFSSFSNVGVDYFRTMGIPLLMGREFTAADQLTAPKVAVVNEAFVRHFLPGRNPLGIRFARGAGGGKLDIEIVGVVKDVAYSRIQEPPPRVYYTPYMQSTRQAPLYFYVRTDLPPEQIAPLVRREVAALDAQLPIRNLKTMVTQIDENLFAERLLSSLTGIFAGLAMALAAVGLYGVLAYNVERRTREIGVRMALGADAGHVRGLVVKEAGWMLVIGTAIGFGAAAATGRLLQAFLFGLKSSDPFVYGSAAVLLWLIAGAAAYLPARRATTVDPLVALRHE